MTPRRDQIMSQALCDWIMDAARRPDPGLYRSIKPALGKGATNLGKMANVLAMGMRLRGSVEAVREIYALSLHGPAFRTAFEGASVPYHGYQFLGDCAAMLYGHPVIATAARESLRWDLTLHCLCSTPRGRVVMACGRIRPYDRDRDGDQDGVTSAEADYRVRAVRGIAGDGWWPPRGIGPKYWSDPASVDARPWRAQGEKLAALIFSAEERAALNAWATRRVVDSALAKLIAPIRLAQVLHIAPAANGHVAWMESIDSYDAGDNTAQPIVWAHGDELAGAVLSESPCGVVRQGGAFFLTTPESGGEIAGVPEIDASREIVIPAREAA